MSQKDYKNCQHIVNGSCFLASELARTDVPINEYVCSVCVNDPYRPKRLNIHVMNLALRYNQTLDEQTMLQVISGEKSGFGDKLATVFGLIKQTPDCRCSGMQDLLNVWTKDYIRENIEMVITQLEIEARNRSIPFSRLLAKMLLLGLLSVAPSPPQEISGEGNGV